MGVVMYGETAAGYGRPRLLAYGRPRPNYVQKIRPAAAAANMKPDLRVHIIRMKIVLFVLCTFKVQSTTHKKYNGSRPNATKWNSDFCNFVLIDVLGCIVHHPKSLPGLLESFQVIKRFTYIVELCVEVGTNKYLIALDLSIGFFTTSQRREKLCYGSKHKIHIENKI